MKKDIDIRDPTFVPGFDDLCNGGLIRGLVHFLSGGPGTGKTQFCMHFIGSGAMAGQTGLFISFEEDVENLKRDALKIGYDFDKLEKAKKAKIMYLYPYELNSFTEHLIKEIDVLNAQRVVIDCTTVFAAELESEYEVRKWFNLVAKELRNLNCTAILTAEMSESYNPESESHKYSRYGVGEHVCDSVITLHRKEDQGHVRRLLRIVKMRRSSHVNGPVKYKITDHGLRLDKGG